MSSSIKHYRGRTRSGFTLVELLIGITIIGLLVGLLAVAGGGVIGTAREFAVNSEIIQMSQSVESFNTRYGFYPPSFEQFRKQSAPDGSSSASFVAAEANQLLPFLNKIAPNHQELSAFPGGGGKSRLAVWWETVGVNLDQSTSLQFWLSGLCQNKQFPLTGNLAAIPVGFNANFFVSGAAIPGGLEREVFYDFDQERFASDASGTTAQYNMEYGKQNGDLFYLYRDSDAYVPAAFDSAGMQIALDRTNPNHRSLAYHFWDGTSPVTQNDFANPNTFQLISFGLDGDPGAPDVNVAPALRGDLNSQLPASSDNLCNFADGRLDKYIDDQQ